MEKWLSISFVIAMLSGCASFEGKEASTMDRGEYISDLQLQIEELGFNEVEIQPGVDEFLNVTASLLERQYFVMGEFREVTANYTNVQGFLHAHEGSTEEELTTAIIAFDGGASTEDEKIGPKLDAYEAAVATIAEKNADLALDIGINLTKSALILQENAEAVAFASGLQMIGGAIGGDNEKTADNDLGLAILRAKDQISLASDANKIISLEQDTIDQINALQVELDAKT